MWHPPEAGAGEQARAARRRLVELRCIVDGEGAKEEEEEREEGNSNGKEDGTVGRKDAKEGGPNREQDGTEVQHVEEAGAKEQPGAKEEEEVPRRAEAAEDISLPQAWSPPSPPSPSFPVAPTAGLEAEPANWEVLEAAVAADSELRHGTAEHSAASASPAALLASAAAGCVSLLACRFLVLRRRHRRAHLAATLKPCHVIS